MSFSPFSRERESWRRAAVLGSLWGALEILLGGFFHNLRVPFRGHLLTALAVAILAGGQRLWRQRGVVWRAGLVAAVMKAITPTAVLLGPMVAIAMEGFLFEFGLLLGGRGLFGVLVGGALAMSWTFLHQLGSLLVTYGLNLLTVYKKLVLLAQSELGEIPLGAWGPVVFLALVNICAGLAAAAVGWKTAAESEAIPLVGQTFQLPTPRPHRPIKPHLAALALLLLALPSCLWGLGQLSLILNLSLVGAYLLILIYRYGAGLRRLLRWRFWLGLFLLAALTAAVFQLVNGTPGGFLLGLEVAMRMTLRALVVSASFAALGVELTHPRLHSWLASLGAGPLLAASEMAFATLPAVVQAMPPAQFLLRKPGHGLAALLAQLNRWLEELEVKQPLARAVLVTGKPQSGKTTFVTQVVQVLQKKGIGVEGILAPGSFREGRRWGFELVEVGSARSMPLCGRESQEGWEKVGGFWVNPRALERGRRVLLATTTEVVVVDEVGPWEMAEKGWAEALEQLVSSPPPLLLLVVRESLLKAVTSKWKLLPVAVFAVEQAQPDKAADEIARLLQSPKTSRSPRPPQT